MSTGKRIGLCMLGLVAVAGIALTVAATAGFGFAPASESRKVAAPNTAEITKQDLIATKEKSGKVANVDERTLKGSGSIVTWLPAVGAKLERGWTLYRVDEVPTILLYGALPAYRNLEPGVEGTDVQQFEQNLAEMGYTGFDVDTSYTWATADAVKAWQKALGIERTGIVAPNQVHYASGALQVTALIAKVGDAGGDQLLTVANQARIVTVDLEEKEAGYAEVGAAVTATLPNGTAFPGKITAVESVITSGNDQSQGPGSGDKTTVLRVSAAPDDPAVLDGIGASTAKVKFTADKREGVLTVPVSALLALAEGGYGVELFDKKQSRLVAVETGLFSEGQVEISGEDISEGERVVVPK